MENFHQPGRCSIVACDVCRRVTRSVATSCHCCVRTTTSQTSVELVCFFAVFNGSVRHFVREFILHSLFSRLYSIVDERPAINKLTSRNVRATAEWEMISCISASILTRMRRFKKSFHLCVLQARPPSTFS